MEKITLENSAVSFEFNKDSGALASIRNKATGNEYLQAPSTTGNIFSVGYDLQREFEISGREGMTPTRADLPAEIAGKLFVPSTDLQVSFNRKGTPETPSLSIDLLSVETGLVANVEVVLEADGPVSTWSMTLKNGSRDPIELFCSFPVFSGIRLGDGQGNLMVAHNQAGYVLPLWAWEGGIYGNAGQMSMQWGCVFDRGSGDAFGFIVKDGEVRNKQIRYSKPTIEVSYFPPVVLEPDEEISLPEVDLLVYEGDWKKTASAYRRWFTGRFDIAPQADWIRNLDGHGAGWFEKRDAPKPDRYPRVSVPLDSFEDLADAYLYAPSDNIEFAFHCSRSMPKETTGKPMLWTDADNVLRSDLGGAPALAEGVRRIHGLGHRLTFYVEGYLCPGDAHIIVSGEGRDWLVMNKDGTNNGNYTKQGREIGSGLLHMCPGAKGWQDHLAVTAARLVRETGADGVRLDSLGFYFFPCFNPLHKHDTPYDYNVWTRRLFEKVAGAVREVNPDCLLTTEAGADFFAEHFTGALTQQNDIHRIAAEHDVPAMRIALPEYCVIPHTTCGPVAASLMGYPGGTQSILARSERMLDLDLKWRAVRHPGAHAMRWGMVCDNPLTDRDDVTCRRFRENGLDVIVGARPKYPAKPDGDEPWTDGAEINADIDVRQDPVSYTVSWKLEGSASAMGYVWDVETLRMEEKVPRIKDGTATIEVQSSWFMAIFGDAQMKPIARMDLPNHVTAGEQLAFEVTMPGLIEGDTLTGSLFAPVLGLDGPSSLTVPGTDHFTVPETMAPGYYTIQLDGEGFLGFRAFLEVRG